MTKPVIGITCNIASFKEDAPLLIRRIYLYEDYVTSINLAGGIGMLIPVNEGADFSSLSKLVSLCDGLCISGGRDIDSGLYGQTNVYSKDTLALLDQQYTELIRIAISQQKPFLGICKGAQLINVALGGTLIQDITLQTGSSIPHEQEIDGKNPSHAIDIEPDSKLASILSVNANVNSFHHQAVDKLGKNLKIVAKSKDGIIEAIEGTKDWILGVQFHPEMMAAHGNQDMLKIFEALVLRASK